MAPPRFGAESFFPQDPFTGGLETAFRVPEFGTPPTGTPFARPEARPQPTFPGQELPPPPPQQAPSAPAPTPQQPTGFTGSGNPLNDLRSMMTGPATQDKIKSIIDRLVAAYPGRVRSLGSSATGVWDKISIDGQTYDFVIGASATGGQWNLGLQPEGPTGGGGLAGLFGGGQFFEDPLSQEFMDAVRQRIGQLEQPAETPELEGLMDLLKRTQGPSALPTAPSREQILSAADPLAAANAWTRQVHQTLLRREPRPDEISMWGAALVFGQVTPQELMQQLLRDNPQAASTLELIGTPFDTLQETLKGQLKPTEGFEDLLRVLQQRETQLGETPADIPGLQQAISIIGQQLDRAQVPPEMQGLEELLGTLRGQAAGATIRPQEALSAEQQLMDLLQGRITELGQGPTATVLAAQEAQAFDALKRAQTVAQDQVLEEAARRGLDPGSGIVLAARQESARGFQEIQAQQQQALILRRHEEEQLRAREQLATASDLAEVTQMREQAALEREELERNLRRQIDLLEEESRARLDAQEDRARDLAIQRSELQRAMQDRLDARQREIVDVVGLRADVEGRERQRRLGVAGQLFGLEDLGRQRQLTNAQTLAALEQSQIDRDQARLDQILNLQSIFPEMGRQALNDALAVLGLGQAANSDISQTLLGVAQLNQQQGQQTNQWLAGLGQALGSGLGGMFGGLSGVRPTEPAAA